MHDGIHTCTLKTDDCLKKIDIASVLINPKISHLRILYKGYTSEIPYEFIHYIADLLKANSTLLTLTLYFSEITLSGLTAIAEMLKVNTTLTTLSLDYIEDENGHKGLAMIEDFLRQNKTLINFSCHKIITSSFGRGGPDCTIRLRVEDHPFLKRNRDNLHITMATLIKAHSDPREIFTVLRILPKDVLLQILNKVNPRMTPKVFTQLHRAVFFKRPKLLTEVTPMAEKVRVLNSLGDCFAK